MYPTATSNGHHPTKHLRMLVHLNGRKFMVVLPIDATVLDCKAEILRVYRAISSSHVDRLCELQDSNQFTLFDEYEIGMLLQDMSEVFATSQELHPHSSSPHHTECSLQAESPVVQVSSTSKRLTANSDTDSASNCAVHDAEVPPASMVVPPSADLGGEMSEREIPTLTSINASSSCAVVNDRVDAGEESNDERVGDGTKVDTELCPKLESVEEVYSCARTLPWSGQKSCSQKDPPKSCKRKKKKRSKGSKRGKREPQVQDSLLSEVCSQDSGTIHETSPSEKVLSTCINDSEKNPENSSPEEVSTLCIEGSRKAVAETTVEGSLSDEASRDSQTKKLLSQCTQEMFNSEVVVEESVVSDSCLSYVSPRGPVPPESLGSDASPIIRLQHEQITKEVREKLLHSGSKAPSSSTCSSDDSSSDEKHSESQEQNEPSLSLLMDRSKGGVSKGKKLTTSMFTPTSEAVQPGRMRKRYSLVNVPTARYSSKPSSVKSLRKKRLSLSKEEESMVANITPANITTLLADEGLW